MTQTLRHQMAAERDRLVRWFYRRAGNDIHVAENLTRETFIAAWNNRDRLIDPSGTTTWLCGITRNILKRWQRQQARQTILEYIEQQVAWTNSVSSKPGQVQFALFIASYRVYPADRYSNPWLGISRGSVRTFYEAPQFPEWKSRSRSSQLDPYPGYLETQYSAAPVTANQLWREISKQSYSGRIRQVARWLSARRQQPAMSHAAVSPPTNTPLIPMADTCHRLITSAPEQLAAEELHHLDQLLHVASLNQLYIVVQSFATIVRQRRSDAFDDWLRFCVSCPILACQRFAESLRQDYDAVKAALYLPWSNGQTEGQIHRLKLLKRQMYGRARLDLLRIRAMYKPA